MSDRQKHLVRLDQIRRLAEGSKWSRFCFAPLTYIKGITWSKVLYRWIGKTRDVRKKTFFGAEMVLGLPAGLDIYLLGGKTHDSEIRLAAFLFRYLKEKQIFFDIGAHVGYFSLLARDCVGSEGRVIGFEASPATYLYYKKNVSRYPNMKAEHLAVSNINGEVVFYEYPVLYSEYNSVNDEQYSQKKWSVGIQPHKVRIPCQSLDDYCMHKKEYPDFVKIDVEGAEFLVLSGADDLLKYYKPVIIMEYIRPEETEFHTSIHVKASEFLLEKGYGIFFIRSNGETEYVNHLSELSFTEESDNIVFIHPDNIPSPCI